MMPCVLIARRRRRDHLEAIARNQFDVAGHLQDALVLACFRFFCSHGEVAAILVLDDEADPDEFRAAA
jgi:hypothetical protein